MKRLAALALFIALATSGSTHAQPGYPGVLNGIAVDYEETMAAPVYDQQVDHYVTHGNKFFQGLPTHSTPPTANQPPDMLSRRPTDQAESWLDWQGDTLAPQNYSLEIVTYDGVAGAGYVSVLRVNLGNMVWEKAYSTGPQTWRTHDWKEVVEDEALQP